MIKNSKLAKAVVLGGLILALSACAKKAGYGNYGEDESGGAGDNMRFFGTHLSPEQERQLLAKRTYYFDYDSFNVREEDTMSVYAHAKKLAGKSKIRIRVEGHTDERGSREYNIALGERRANAISNLLALKGISQSQISVVSYGKEKPETQGSDESAWSRNRRAVIVYEVE
jgi:peptidoglycan-associated lipoprotein